MKYKKIITCGCSFSETEKTAFTWPNLLEEFIIKNIDSTIKFDHRGLSSQGQDLIQRKAAHAIYEALTVGYKPTEIAVFVMWTTFDRKAFYIDNPDVIDEIVDGWKGSQQGWERQFVDLKNEFSHKLTVKSMAPRQNTIAYNGDGGWFITSSHVPDGVAFIKHYFMMGEEAYSPGMCEENLQNMLMLQYLCKSKGITLYQMYTMDSVIEDINRHKNHQIIEHLHDDLDHSGFISEQSMSGYLRNRTDDKFFDSDTDSHPNALGHAIWVKDIILPFLHQRNFFE